VLRRTPSNSLISVPIRFWPPSPRVREQVGYIIQFLVPEETDHAGVLIVGVGGYIQDRPENIQLFDSDMQVRGIRFGRFLRVGEERDKEKQYSDSEHGGLLA
jgi:hypothetical protein